MVDYIAYEETNRGYRKTKATASCSVVHMTTIWFYFTLSWSVVCQSKGNIYTETIGPLDSQLCLFVKMCSTALAVHIMKKVRLS